MKRGQAALEFLTTYGWAFLVILVMIGALAYFGVLNPKGLLPSRCTFGPEISCLEQQVSASGSQLSFRFRNDVGSTASFSFNATYLGGTNPEVSCTDVLNLGAGRVDEVNCTFDGTHGGQANFNVGDTVKFSINANYTKSDGLYPQPVSGDVYGAVSE